MEKIVSKDWLKSVLGDGQKAETLIREIIDLDNEQFEETINEMLLLLLLHRGGELQKKFDEIDETRSIFSGWPADSLYNGNNTIWTDVTTTSDCFGGNYSITPTTTTYSGTLTTNSTVQIEASDWTTVSTIAATPNTWGGIKI